MDAKISVTTCCNAKCKTCPVWGIPGDTMSLENFAFIWKKLVAAPQITKVMLNNTGDLYSLSDHRAYFELIHRDNRVWLAMTTNAIALDTIPDVDEVVISFNGGTRETYEDTVGASFDSVRANIRAQYDALRKIKEVRLDCLMYEGNQGTETDLLREWHDFPGGIRVSYKYDNQGKQDKTLRLFRRVARIPCDYLDKICILPSGKVVSCAHDFHAVTDFGNILTDSIEQLIENPARLEKKREHAAGKWIGLCERCNYNTSTEGKFFNVKSRTA